MYPSAMLNPLPRQYAEYYPTTPEHLAKSNNLCMQTFSQHPSQSDDEQNLKPSTASPRTPHKPDSHSRPEENIGRLRTRRHIPAKKEQKSAIAQNRRTPNPQIQGHHNREKKQLTTQAKHPPCHSNPNAFTTTSVTGLLHPLHFALYRFVWQFTHQAYPSFSTNGVLESNGSPHWAQKKWPECHDAPQATMTSPSMGVLQDLQRGLKSSWKSRWQ